MNISNEEKEAFLFNGLYTTMKVMLKGLKHQHITEEEFINESQKLFKLWEQLKNQGDEYES